MVSGRTPSFAWFLLATNIFRVRSPMKWLCTGPRIGILNQMRMLNDKLLYILGLLIKVILRILLRVGSRLVEFLGVLDLFLSGSGEP